MPRFHESWTLGNCLNVYQKALGICTPRNKRYLRASDSSFINETISKVIVDRTRPRNKFSRNRALENKLAYNKQRIFCLSLLRKAKRIYYNNLDQIAVADSELFCKAIKPFQLDKGK